MKRNQIFYKSYFYFPLKYINADLKISLMFVFIWTHYPENFEFLILGILELFVREVCKFQKSRLVFNIFYYFRTFYISHVRISQNVKGVLM